MPSLAENSSNPKLPLLNAAIGRIDRVRISAKTDCQLSRANWMSGA